MNDNPGRPRLITLPRFLDHRGNLSVVEQTHDIPFEIKRVYWIYDVPGGEDREGHAYHENNEFIIALSGSLDVVVDDGKERATFSLNRSYYGLFIPAGFWRELTNFSTNSVAMVLASTNYCEEDYITDYKDFISLSSR